MPKIKIICTREQEIGLRVSGCIKGCHDGDCEGCQWCTQNIDFYISDQDGIPSEFNSEGGKKMTFEDLIRRMRADKKNSDVIEVKYSAFVQSCGKESTISSGGLNSLVDQIVKDGAYDFLVGVVWGLDAIEYITDSESFDIRHELLDLVCKKEMQRHEF